MPRVLPAAEPLGIGALCRDENEFVGRRHLLARRGGSLGASCLAAVAARCIFLKPCLKTLFLDPVWTGWPGCCGRLTQPSPWPFDQFPCSNQGYATHREGTGLALHCACFSSLCPETFLHPTSLCPVHKGAQHEVRSRGNPELEAAPAPPGAPFVFFVGFCCPRWPRCSEAQQVLCREGGCEVPWVARAGSSLILEHFGVSSPAPTRMLLEIGGCP